MEYFQALFCSSRGFVSGLAIHIRLIWPVRKDSQTPKLAQTRNIIFSKSTMKHIYHTDCVICYIVSRQFPLDKLDKLAKIPQMEFKKKNLIITTDPSLEWSGLTGYAFRKTFFITNKQQINYYQNSYYCLLPFFEMKSWQTASLPKHLNVKDPYFCTREF